MTTSRHIAPLDFLHAIGLSAMVLTASFSPLIFAGRTRLHSSEPLTAVVLANVFEILLIGLFLFVGFAILRGLRTWPAYRLLLVILLPVLVVMRNASFFPRPVHHKTILLGGVVWTILVLLLRFHWGRWYAGMLRAGRIVLTGFGIFALLALAEMAWTATWHPGPQEIRSPGGRMQAVSPANHPLLVWIVLDELSYDQLFEHRAADISLPNFDAFRSESSVYTQVQPAGFKTEEVLPSLLIGKTVTAVDYTPSNRMLIRTAGHHGWQPFDIRQSLFAEARRDGWHTAVVGWFIPYCPTFQDWVDSCYWEGWGLLPAPMSTFVGTRANMAISLKVLGEKLVAPQKSRRDDVSFQVQQRLASFLRLETRSIALLKSPDADFIFLHLPLPHPPGIYNRRTGRFARAAGRSYLDNLVLADAVLGNMLAILRASPRWPETTIIVNGDHGWRIPIWQADVSWTPEDQRASRGIFDPRPALLIHRPGQSAPVSVTEPFPLLGLHGIVSSILRAPALGPATDSATSRDSSPISRRR